MITLSAKNSKLSIYNNIHKALERHFRCKIKEVDYGASWSFSIRGECIIISFIKEDGKKYRIAFKTNEGRAWGRFINK